MKKKSINCPWGFTLYILRYASGSFFCYSTKEQSSDSDRRSREAGKPGGVVPQLQWHRRGARTGHTGEATH